MPKILYLLNDAPFFFSHRVNLARSVQAENWSVHVSAPHTDETTQMRFKSDQFIFDPYRSDSFRISIIKSLYVLYGIVGRIRPDLVHVVTLKCTIMWFFVGIFYRGTPSVHTLAGFGQLAGAGWKARLGKRLIEALIWITARYPRTIFVIQNETDYEDLKRRGIIPKDRIRLVQGSGVDTARFTPAHKTRGPVLRVGTAARRLNSKGFPALAMLAHACREAGLPVRFVVASAPADGHADAVPDELWRNWLAADLFEDAGHVDDMPGFYRSLDVFIYLSLYGEGLAKTLLEAGSCGLPIITTAQNGCKDAVIHGETGFVCDPMDQMVLLKNIEFLKNDDAALRRMGAASRRLIEDKFSDMVVIEKMKHIYREAMALDN